MRAVLLFLLGLWMFETVGQEIQREVISASGSMMSGPKIELSGTVGEPIVGVVQQKNAIGQGFWSGGLIVEPLSNSNELNEIVLYPNPVEENFEIYSGSLTLVGIAVFAINGQRVMTRTIDESTTVHAIDVSMLANGAYVLHVFVADTRETKKFKLIKR